jgi:hypothetical protein
MAKLVERETLPAQQSAAAGWYTPSQDRGKTREWASTALTEAEESRKKGTLDAARARVAFAYLLSETGGDPGAVSKAQAAIEEIDKELQKAWAKAVPELDRRLDLVLRDKSLEDALVAIRVASGLRIRLQPGSIEDATALLGGEEPRVTYLDLRGATVAEALNWLFVPARLSWWVSEGTVTVGTARRSGVPSPWVYDVSALVLPTAKELEAGKNQAEKVAVLTKAVEQFLSAARAALSTKEDAALWYAPGQLLLFGDTAIHAAAAKLFADLANPDAKLDGALDELRKAAVPRAKEHEAARAKVAPVKARAELAGALAEHAWPLLAAAAAGELDLEALTELQVAWRSPAMGELMKAAPALVLRTAWAVSEAARALSKEQELAALARAAQATAREAAEKAVDTLDRTPQDAQAFLGVLYAALTLRDDAAFVAKARPALAKARIQGMPEGSVGALVAALLGVPTDEQRKALASLISGQSQALNGDDAVVLAALACRRAGGEAWLAFRANARDLLGRQPLEGSVVILINRLGRPSSPLVSASR